MIKEIKYSDDIFGIIGNIDECKDGLNFLTDPSKYIQVATFKYQKDHIMNGHVHPEYINPLKTKQTQEILLVWQGSVELTVFDLYDIPCEKHVLNKGDFYIYFKGGVKYVVLEDNTKLLEVKSGPFFEELDSRKIEKA